MLRVLVAIFSLLLIVSCTTDKEKIPPLDKLSWAMFYRGDVNSAVQVANECVDKSGPAGCFVLLGMVERNNKNYQSAIDWLSRYEAEKEKEKQKADDDWDKFLYLTAAKEKGVAFYNLGDLENAINYLSIFDESRENEERSFDLYSEILFLSYYGLGEYKNAINVLESYESVESVEKSTSYCWITYNLAAVYSKTGVPDKSLTWAKHHAKSCDMASFLRDAKEDNDFDLMFTDIKFIEWLNELGMRESH